MNTMRNYLVLWLSGLVAGMILMERWHRLAGGPEPSPAIHSIDEAPRPVTPEASMNASKLVDLVVTGAKLDVQSMRRWISRTGTGPFPRAGADLDHP